MKFSILGKKLQQVILNTAASGRPSTYGYYSDAIGERIVSYYVFKEEGNVYIECLIAGHEHIHRIDFEG